MAFVLAGGRGSRLLELTDKRAKNCKSTAAGLKNSPTPRKPPHSDDFQASARP